MRIETTRFGPLKINREEIIYFPEGLLGFPENTRFVFIDVEGQPTFRWLQAIDNPDLAFVVVKPEKFLWSYAPRLSLEEKRALGAERSHNLEFWLIVTIPEDPAQMTANLRGPLVINRSTRRGRQVVLADESYSTRHLILKELEKSVAEVQRNGDMLLAAQTGG